MSGKSQITGMLKDWGVAIILTVVAIAGWNFLQPSVLDAGTKAPPIRAHLLDGQELPEAPGVRVVNFWATWCAPCRREIPAFSRYATKNADIQVVGVSVDELSTDRLNAFSEKLGITYEVVHDARSDDARRWGVTVYPTTFIIRPDGTVASAHAGPLEYEELASMVDQAR